MTHTYNIFILYTSPALMRLQSQERLAERLEERLQVALNEARAQLLGVRACRMWNIAWRRASDVSRTLPCRTWLNTSKRRCITLFWAPT